MSCAAAPSAAALWLLEAKAFAQEDRSAAATSARYWLKPGAYGVGKPGHADVAIEEDKSISRRHGQLTVPAAAERAEGELPYVLIKGGWGRVGAGEGFWVL